MTEFCNQDCLSHKKKLLYNLQTYYSYRLCNTNPFHSYIKYVQIYKSCYQHIPHIWLYQFHILKENHMKLFFIMQFANWLVPLIKLTYLRCFVCACMLLCVSGWIKSIRYLCLSISSVLFQSKNILLPFQFKLC